MDAHYDRSHPVIFAKDFCFSYENSRDLACQIEDLEIYSGECLVLCGPSGSGKSTFLKLVNGLIPDYYPGRCQGLFCCAGYSFGEQSVEDFSYHVTSVFQNPATQFFHKKVKHELVFPCENKGEKLAEIISRLNLVSQNFQLTKHLERDIFTLSGGEKERVALGTAMMQATDILVFDEPTANLDRSGMARLMTEMQGLKEKGKTLLVAEHRLDYLYTIADKYLYFDKGKLVKIYTREEFLAMDEKERKVLGLRSLSETDTLEKLPKVSMGGVREGGTVEIENLRLQAGDSLLSEIPYLSLRAGQITGLVGKNGQGKTTFAHYLAGLLDHEGLSISFQGIRLSPRERLKRTALVMQDVRFQLFSESVKKELLLGTDRNLENQDLITSLGLTDLLERHPMSLSGGEQQRVIIASSLLSDKDIFIFDEPTSGLDYRSMKAVAALLQELREKGKVILLISHDEELLAETCDNLLCF